jgi:hypothetical protein
MSASPSQDQHDALVVTPTSFVLQTVIGVGIAFLLYRFALSFVLDLIF